VSSDTPRRRDKSLVQYQEAWTAFRCALLLAVPHLSSGLRYAKPLEARAARSLDKFRQSLWRSFSNRGLVEVCARLKAIAHWARERALNGELKTRQRVPFAGSVRRVLDSSKQRMFLVSQLGRALPADPTGGSRALKKHRTVLTQAPPEIPDMIYDHVREFSEEAAMKVRSWGSSWARPLGSASLEHSRAEGGQVADLVSSYKEVASIAWVPLPPRYGYPVNKGVPSLAASMVWREAGSSPLAGYGDPKVRAVAVPERGWKTRVVTAGNASEQVRGHVLRDIFWPILDVLPSVCHKGELDEDEKVSELMASEPGSDAWVVSTDLSAATDYAPFALARAVWTGIFSALVKRNDLQEDEAATGLREVLRHLGPHTVVWPDGEELSQRGWLMGHPLTWLTLNLAHCACLDAAGLLGQARVKGDDAIVVGRRGEIEEYLLTLELSGFVINRSKTFWSRDSGIFCERRCTLGSPVAPQVPVKRVVPVTPDRLADLSNQVARLPRGLRRAYIRVIWERASSSGLIGRCRKLGIPLSLPRELGGLGLPHRRGFQWSLRAHRRWVTACVTSTKAQGVLPLWCSVAEARAYRATTDGLRWTTRNAHRRGELGTEVPAEWSAVMRFVGIRSLGCAFQKPLNSQPRTLASISSEWRKVRRYLRENGSPPTLINPTRWTPSRLAGALASCKLAGIYTSGWTTHVIQQGLSLDDVKATWAWM
jgi:hypothetical protein